ncbi:MAG: hypothetical protein KI785_06755 [Devosiaceae bacterium]|nr:hypothetical protein [Devosiaceae bacterium MH13]
MFDRSVLFVGSGGSGLAALAEALGLEHRRQSNSAVPLRVYSATLADSADIDPILLRVVDRLGLDASALTLKPIALFSFAGAPRIDHLITLNAQLPTAMKLALGERVDVRNWTLRTKLSDAQTPGERNDAYRSVADELREPVAKLIDELGALSGVSQGEYARTA